MIAVDLRERARGLDRGSARAFEDLVTSVRALRGTSEEIQRLAIATWRGRMRNEHGSARVFERLAVDLGRAGLPGADVCRGFADEERRHGALCGAVVEALGDEARFEEDVLDYPDHDDVGPLEGALRSAISIGCLSETVAVALIHAERLDMPDGPLRDLLGRILADEVGHSRFGWKLVARVAPTLDADARARLDDYLVVALDHLEDHELANLATGTGYGPEGAALGLCSGEDARAIFYATVREVIVPRLREHGLLRV